VYIGGHQGKIEDLRLIYSSPSVNSSSIVGVTPALKRLKVIQFGGDAVLTSQQISEMSGVAADCDSVEEFGFREISTEDIKATYLSTFVQISKSQASDTT
jgi:hypothetical protein